MVHKFVANCSLNGRGVPVTLYIGNPSAGNHPLNFQSRWLSEMKGVSVPGNIMESFSKLNEIAEKHRVSFDELCKYVIEELKNTDSVIDDSKGATMLARVDKEGEKSAKTKEKEPKEEKKSKEKESKEEFQEQKNPNEKGSE